MTRTQFQFRVLWKRLQLRAFVKSLKPLWSACSDSVILGVGFLSIQEKGCEYISADRVVVRGKRK